MKLRQVAIHAAVALLILTGQAGAQGSRTANGRLLDANPRVGSGGRNTSSPGYRPLDSQLYVTGQVTGLGRFRDSVGYTPENELGVTVPSAQLDEFRRQSVSVEDVTGTTATYRPSPYVSRTRGVRTPANVRDQALYPQYGLRGSQDDAYDDRYLQPGQVPSNEQLLSQPTSAAGMRSFGRSGRAGYQGGYQGTGGYRPGAEAMFGLFDAGDRQSLALEFYRLGQRRREATDRDRYLDRPGGMRNIPRSVRPVEAGRTEVPPADSEDGFAVDPAGEQARPGPDDAGQDMFHDLLRHFGHLDGSAGAPAGQGPQAVLRSAARKPVTIDRLAGASPDPINAYMRLGQQQLAENRFYDAAEQFGQAIARERRNPLAHAGRGISLFAAGEPKAASEELETSLKLFPEMIATRIDVLEMIDAKVYESRMASLERKLTNEAASPDPNLLFLATFLSHNAGDENRAKRYARMLRSSVSGDTDAYLLRYAEGVSRMRNTGGDDQGPADSADPGAAE